MVEEIRAHKEEYMELKKVERGMKRLESFDHSALMKDLFQLFSSPVMEELSSRALYGDLQTLFLQVSFVLCCHHKPQNATTFLRTEILEMGCFELPNKTQTLLSSQVHMCSC